MNLSVCVVEDQQDCRRQLCTYVERYGRNTDKHIAITEYTDGDELVEHYRPGNDIILLDIAMRFMDGMETARAIRKIDDSVIIIFVTNAPQYAMAGYEVQAFDYILKPVSYGVFYQHFDHAVRTLERRCKTEEHMVFAVQGGVRRVAERSIRYIEVNDHTLIVHTTNGDIKIRGTLRDIEKQLNSSMFFRCNKMFIANLDFIDAIDGNDVTIGNDTILVSRSRRKPLLDALNARMSGITIEAQP